MRDAQHVEGALRLASLITLAAKRLRGVVFVQALQWLVVSSWDWRGWEVVERGGCWGVGY